MNKIYKLIVLFFFASNLIQAQNPNILFITVDDMNWNSIGSYGSNVEGITPNIDKLASEGLSFDRAYVQASNCSPSRNVFQTSRYPHQSGMRGFYFVEANFKSLPEILKENGYITAVLNKATDTSLNKDFDKYWDYYKSLSGSNKRSAKVYEDLLTNFLKEAEKNKKPFYCVVNVADPHKPFFNDEISRKKGFDIFKPSKVYKSEDIEVPAFLPNVADIKDELLNYYNSVKRGDDCVGAVLNSLDKSKFNDNTIVIFVSDHGMPLPYAKSSIYENGLRTPWIVKWPNHIKKGSRNSSLISAVDFMPTVLDIAKIETPKGAEGKSIAPQLKGISGNTGYVYGQFDENAGGHIRPSRSVVSSKYRYIFNPWSDGELEFLSAASNHKTYKTMKRLSASDESIKKRFDFWVYRSKEELYDIENDPDCLVNLIDNKEYAEVLDEHRSALLEWMKSTNDYVLEAFENKDDDKFLKEFIAKEYQNSIWRSKNIMWKRFSNMSGKTKDNKMLYKVNK